MAAVTQEMAAMTLKTAVPAPPKLKKGSKGKPINVVTNSYTVELKPNLPFFLHDIRMNAVYIHKGEEKLKEITKQSKGNDFTEQERKHAALLAFVAMREAGTIKGDFMYDRAALLVSLAEIAKGGAEFKHSLTAKSAPKLFGLPQINQAQEVRVTIKKAADTYQVSTNDLNSKNEAARLALQSIVNIATSQALFERYDKFVVYGNGNAYLLRPEDYKMSNFDVGTKDKEGGVGLTKGARLVEGPGGAAAMAITIDTKKTAFHQDWQPVSEKLIACGCAKDHVEATHVLQGLQAVVFYEGVPKEKQRARTITIGSVSTQRVRDISFKDENGKIKTMVQHVREKYSTTIRNVDAFVIVDKYDQNCVYSPEVLLVAPNQRVKTENIQSVNIEKLIRVSATLPAIRQAETASLAKALDASKDNSAQVRRGITVDTSKQIKVVARCLAPVQLGTGNGVPIAASGPWRQGRIAQTPLDRFSKWTILHINNGYESPDLAHSTVQALERVASGIGYTIKMSKNIVVVQSASSTRDQEAQLEEIFAREKQAGSQFMLIICNGNIKNHALIKYMEIRHDIVTEQLTSKVAEKLFHQSNTASNVVLKICEKLGGQNHYIAKSTVDLPGWITAKGTMIVGLQMEHPSSMSKKEKDNNVMPSRPVFIGYSSNAVRGAAIRGATDAQQEKEATHFSADWSYAMPKDFQDGTAYTKAYNDVVLSILRSFKKYRDCIPSRIVLIRGGVTEGDYAKIRSEEVPIWEAAFKQLNPAYSPSFIVVTVNERHSDRFYLEKIPAGEKAPKQNLPSGTVIDSGVTNPAYPQSFIQSHQPLQGTAKVPSYIPQHAFLNPAHKLALTMDEIERTVHSLCFAHGVCNTPTAVPTPLYIARESMKRASELFAFWQRRSGGRSFDLDTLKKELTLNADTSAIHGLRVNA